MKLAYYILFYFNSKLFFGALPQTPRFIAFEFRKESYEKKKYIKIIIPLRFTLNKKNDKIYLERIKEVFFHGKTKEMDFRRKGQNS